MQFADCVAAVNQPSLVRFPEHVDSNGTLCVYECGRDVAFSIKRLFTVRAGNGEIRGNHAHRQCTQLLVCVFGTVGVTCDNGSTVSEFLLDGMNTGLLIPPGIWARETFVTREAVLMVLCDRAYEAHDYLNDYAEFRTYLEHYAAR